MARATRYAVRIYRLEAFIIHSPSGVAIGVAIGKAIGKAIGVAIGAAIGKGSKSRKMEETGEPGITNTSSCA